MTTFQLNSNSGSGFKSAGLKAVGRADERGVVGDGGGSWLLTFF